MPCPRCKRVLINAGIKEVITIDENGEIKKYEIVDWIKEDKENYFDIVKKARNNQL